MSFIGRLRLASATARLTRLQARRQAHDHHEIVNPGPPITLDYMPVPQKPYGVVYGELQSKFNMYLIITGVFAASALALALYDDVFAYKAICKPESYRYKQPGVLAK
ncbi:unnamed protein product [Bursaphelenchus okinawaensis]|uniref:Deltamethrin resistance protein prag01 domain-containing protein n=1 Tax=Bursaphelenchus okinawaensis TaxID=465554 RepID=A0A811KHN6_9BILA|nr:unnamed protein product [Bursaphelenchus okinawaensis]CAG9103341.1 unnamed protein product [Bursaphelenchus okinawaensis]